MIDSGISEFKIFEFVIIVIAIGLSELDTGPNPFRITPAASPLGGTIEAFRTYKLFSV
jgi:hypothetical protein